MQALILKFLAPTNSRGARIKAVAGAGHRVYGWDHAHDTQTNMEQAAQRFIAEHGWQEAGSWSLGQCHNGDYVAVCAGRSGNFQFIGS